MFNLYTNAIDQNGFMALVTKNVNVTSSDHLLKSKRIITSFAIVGILVLSIIANGTQQQVNAEAQKIATVASYKTFA